jgi:hypothetical protein
MYVDCTCSISDIATTSPGTLRWTYFWKGVESLNRSDLVQLFQQTRAVIPRAVIVEAIEVGFEHDARDEGVQDKERRLW